MKKAPRITSELSALITTAIAAHVFPGAVLAWSKEGETTILPFGNYTYDPDSPLVSATTQYDIASVTKSIPTNSLILQLLDQKKLSLNDKAITFLPEIENEYRETITIRHLLTYTVVLDTLPLSQIALLGSAKIHEAIFKSPLQAKPGEKYFYTNTPALLLGMIAERVYGKKLDILANEQFFQPLKMLQTSFFPNPANTPPTEIDWRGEVQGVPHDETAWQLRQDGIVAGNAGLFSTAGDLLTFMNMLLAGGTAEEARFFNKATVQAMQTNQLEYLGEEVGLGWELHQPWFMGETASAQAFGKRGFTGCMVMADPYTQTAMVLLSNRTYPQRPSSPNAMNTLRTQVNNLIFNH